MATDLLNNWGEDMKISGLIGIALAGLLAGCASNYDVSGVASMTPTGDAFSKALHKRYVERAKFEQGEYDWASVDFFTNRARMAASGKAPEPQKLEERRFGDAKVVPEIKSARDRLVAALATNAPKDNPDACALAQTWFEHWMEQQEEGHQPDHIAMAKDGYLKAIPMCVVKVAAPAPAPMAPAPAPVAKVVKTFTVYFDHDKTAITPAAQAILADAAKSARELSPTNVFVVGHADTSGAAAYNEKLAAKRAKAVAEALSKIGVASRVLDVKAKGETTLAVKTADNKKEPRNRRVEIQFEK
jgi:OOP family OmpA-OmpF porin